MIVDIYLTEWNVTTNPSHESYLISWKIFLDAVVETEVDHVERAIASNCCWDTFI